MQDYHAGKYLFKEILERIKKWKEPTYPIKAYVINKI